MIRKTLYILPVLMIILLSLAACAKQSFVPIAETSLTDFDKQETIVEIDDNQVLTVWTHEDIFQYSLPYFLERFPDVEVEIEVEENKNRLVSNYRSSLVSNHSATPDIFVIPNEYLGTFSSINGLENLLEEPYYDPTYLEEQPKGLLQTYIHTQKEEMTMVPLLYHPFVTFYRADILEELGYPSEPEELGAYLEDPVNWLNMARDLKNKGYYTLDTDKVFFETIFPANYFMDESHQYIGDSEDWMDIQRAAISIHNEQLSFNKTIWDVETQEAIRNDQLVMFLGASYLEYTLKEWSPDQEGKWAITTLPFGLTALDHPASMSIAINSQSDNKLLAWEFVKQMSSDMLNMYKGTRQEDYYQNENLIDVLWKSLSKQTDGKPHVLDEEIRMLWGESIKNHKPEHSISMEEVESYHSNIKDRIQYEQQLLQQLNQSKQK